MEMFKLKGSDTEQDKRLVAIYDVEGSPQIEVAELSLSGQVSDSFLVERTGLELISNPSASWKAAFLVWKNSVIRSNLQDQSSFERGKYRSKLIELLAHKYEINPEVLFEIIKELDEVDF